MLSFADGLKGLIPYGEVPEVRARDGISGLELPNPYEMVLRTTEGESVEIPWDFARNYCDATYRPTIEAIAALGRQTIGERVRRFRESSGLTQQALARAANIGRATLVRLGKRRTVPQVQDPEGGRRRPGDGSPGLAGRAGILAPVGRRGSYTREMDTGKWR